MLFSSISFLYLFLPGVCLAYYLVGFLLSRTTDKKLALACQNAILLLASLLFYAWGEPKIVLVMLVQIAVNYGAALLLEGQLVTAGRRLVLIAILVVNLGLLGYFKYVNFFITSINSVTGLNLTLLKVSLPIGISFYTFQMVSYVVDVYAKRVKAQKNPIILATYVAMFPQLIAGPIVRYQDVETQLLDRDHTFEGVWNGIRRFILGLSKKVLIANAMGELCQIYIKSEKQTVVYAWMYAIAYMLQIYFDFSGYSDMAIGLGKVFGINLLENFNYPYISKSITEFWRRWHMSLGNWFRDYVYIPLGGNRVSTAKWIRNILIVWGLTGLWHGAAWNFLIWGLFYGVLLLLEKIIRKNTGKELNPVLGHIYTLLAVMIGFVIFNADTMSQAWTDISGLIGLRGTAFINTETVYYLRSYAVLFIVGIIGATPLPRKLAVRVADKKVCQIIEPVILIILLVLVTAYIVDGSFNPFLYFRF